MTEPEPPKPREERKIASTALQQWWFFESERLEETNSEIANFFNLQNLLDHGLAMIRAELAGRGVDLDDPRTDGDRKWSARVKPLEDFLDKVIKDSWAVNTESNKMTHQEALSYSYHLLNAGARKVLVKVKAILMELAIIPREMEDDAADRIVMKVYARPKTK